MLCNAAHPVKTRPCCARVGGHFSNRWYTASMSRRSPSCFSSAGLLALAVTTQMLATSEFASAQFPSAITASDGPAFFQINPYSGGSIGSGPTCSLSGTGAGGLNFLNQAWWWARVDGSDIREFAVVQASPHITAPTANTIRIEYDNAMGRQWRIVIEFVVTSLGGNAAHLTERFSITNMGGPAVSNISLFNFNNITLNGTPTNDLATQTGPYTIDFADGGNPLYHGIYEAVTPGSIAVGPSLRNLLANTGVDNLPAGSIASGPANLEVATQWSFDLGVGPTRTFEVSYTAIPSPAPTGLLAAAGLWAARRRRR